MCIDRCASNLLSHGCHKRYGTHDITLATRFLGISVRPMATVFGKIEELDSSQEDWPQYMERLGYFFNDNGIESAEKKRAVLLTLIRAATYKLLRSLVAPSKPGEKTYQELIQALTAHFSPTPSPIMCRFKFHSRCRQPGESIAVFVSQLRSLLENCGFGDTLEDMLRDRLVCGIRDDAIQKWLLAEHDLNFAKAAQLTLSMETAAKNVKELQQPSGTPTTSTGSYEVLKVTQPRQGKKILPTAIVVARLAIKAHSVVSSI